MFATSYNLFPEYLWLATLLLVAALPPLALAWIRRGGVPNRRLLLTSGALLTVWVLIGSLDFWNFCVLAFSEEFIEAFPGGWSRLAPLLVQAYGGFFLKSTGCVFAGSCVLTLFAAAVLRLRRALMQRQ